MMQKIISFILAVIAFFAQLFGINKPIGVEQYLDISYGADENQSVDLYLPKNVSSPCPMIIFIHGGAWIGGDKSSYKDNAVNYAKNSGCAAASINYRFLYQDGVDGDVILSDIESAIEKIKEKCDEKGVAVSSVGIGGESAGAHLSMLYSYKNQSVCPFKIGFCFSLAGPVDFTIKSFYTDNDAGSDFVYELMSAMTGLTVNADTLENDDVRTALLKHSPISYVNENSVPTIIAHGKKDMTVPYDNSVELDAALTAAGVAHDFVTFPNSDHNLNSDPDCLNRTEELINRYISEYLK